MDSEIPESFGYQVLGSGIYVTIWIPDKYARQKIGKKQDGSQKHSNTRPFEFQTVVDHSNIMLIQHLYTPLYSGVLNARLVWYLDGSCLIAKWSSIWMPLKYWTIIYLEFTPSFEYWTPEYRTSKSWLFRSPLYKGYLVSPDSCSALALFPAIAVSCWWGSLQLAVVALVAGASTLGTTAQGIRQATGSAFKNILKNSNI